MIMNYIEYNKNVYIVLNAILSYYVISAQLMEKVMLMLQQIKIDISNNKKYYLKYSNMLFKNIELGRPQLIIEIDLIFVTILAFNRKF